MSKIKISKRHFISVLSLCWMFPAAVATAQMAQTSMADGERYTARNGNAVVAYEYATGKAAVTLADLSGRLDFNSYVLSGDESKILFSSGVEPVYRHSYRADSWLYDISTGKLVKLSHKGKHQAPALSPDGSKVAFVRDNDLYYIDLSDPDIAEHRVTSDGKFNHIINGIPDWVYEEEFGFSRAYQWSPDSRSIAYMRFDESSVREYNMNVFKGELYPAGHTFKYPKAGEQNSLVEVWCYDTRSGSAIRIDVGNDPDQYIPRIMWTPKNQLLVFRLNRSQNFFEVLCAYDGVGMRSYGNESGERIIYSESNDRYVERVDESTITFTSDGDRFIVRSERGGYMHLYLYSVSEGYIAPITSGPWEVTGINAVEGDKIYYTSTESSPLRRDLYVIGIDGQNKRLLTGGDGTYSARFSAGAKYYIRNFSNTRTPATTTLHRADGSQVRVLSENKALRTQAAEGKIALKELFTFTTPQGVELNGYMIKPLDFDPSHKYPLFMTQYSGPGSQSVSDSWGSGWEASLVSQGYIVACVDGRGTGFRGEEFKKCTYMNLGKIETEDQIEAARWFASQSYIDPSRIGIYGWSYGGFMALNCILKGNDVFKLAVAVAPVTNWRYYDTIYTELYNGMPGENPSGYDDNSPVNFAGRLSGKLLIAHGTADDNVHIQNTYEMISALYAADKDFEMFIVPDQNHGMGSVRQALIRKCIRFVKDNL